MGATWLSSVDKPRLAFLVVMIALSILAIPAHSQKSGSSSNANLLMMDWQVRSSFEGEGVYVDDASTRENRAPSHQHLFYPSKDGRWVHDFNFAKKSSLQFVAKDPAKVINLLRKKYLVIEDVAVAGGPKDYQVSLSCGTIGCGWRVSIADGFSKLSDKKGESIVVPVGCLVRPEQSLETPQSLDITFQAAGAGKLLFSDIYFSDDIDGGAIVVDCPARRLVSTTAVPPSRQPAAGWWFDRHDKILQQKRKVDLALLGDSITQGWEDIGGNAIKTAFRDNSVVNLGFSGDRTENLLWRLKNGELDGLSPRVVVILIGTNNTGHRLDGPREIFDGIIAICQEVKKVAAASKIFVVSLLPRELISSGKLRANNDQVNALLSSNATNYGFEYIDATGLFINEGGGLRVDLMPDLLHLNSLGYELLAKKLKSEIGPLLFQSY